MKSFTFKGKEIKITKDSVLVTTGITLILLSAVLLGLFAWANFIVNGNFDKQFWLKYIFTIASVLLGFFGMLIIRISNERKNPAFLTTKLKLKQSRINIIENKVINQTNYWLKWVHNYTKRVDKLSEMIILKQEKLKVFEKPDDDLKNINAKQFKKQTTNYEKYIEKREILEKYLEEVETHYKIIDDCRKNNGAKIKELKKELKTNLLPKVYRKIEEVTYSKLFNSIYKNSKQDNITINYASVVVKNIMPKLLLGAAFTLLATSVIPEFADVGWAGLLTLVINLSTLIGYLFVATTTAQNIAILENQADENKLDIVSNFKEDLIKYNGKKWEDVDEREEIENINTGA